MQKGGNKILKFVRKRMPAIIAWELWVHYAQCKYGNETPSGAGIIFKVCKGVMECIHKKWLGWDLDTMPWGRIVDKMVALRAERIVRIVKWCRPLEGYLRINVASRHGVATAVVIAKGCLCMLSELKKCRVGLL